MEQLRGFAAIQKSSAKAAKIAGEKVQTEIERLLVEHKRLGGDNFVAMMELHDHLCLSDSRLDDMSGQGIHSYLQDKKWGHSHPEDTSQRDALDAELTSIAEQYNNDDTEEAFTEGMPTDLPSIDIPGYLSDTSDASNERQLSTELVKTAGVVLAIRLKLERIGRALAKDHANPYGQLAVIHDQANRINAKKPKLVIKPAE